MRFNEKFVLLRCGLANRLRTIAAFIYILQNTNISFTLHWDISDQACNGKFHDIFESLNIPKLKLVDSQMQNVDYCFIGQGTIREILQAQAPLLIPPEVKACCKIMTSFIKDIENTIYPLFVPVLSIRQKVADFVPKKEYSAIHIRRTDHINLAKRNDKLTVDAEFEDFIKECSHPVFLATDCTKTQKCFLKKFSDIIFVYNVIDGKGLRQTTLEHALIDILIAAGASKFKGSGFSSYSYLVMVFHRLKNQNK